MQLNLIGKLCLLLFLSACSYDIAGMHFYGGVVIEEQEAYEPTKYYYATPTPDFLTPTPLSPCNVANVGTSKLNVRDAPNGTIIAALKSGTWVTIVNEQIDWYAINSPVVGFVYKYYINCP